MKIIVKILIILLIAEAYGCKEVVRKNNGTATLNQKVSIKKNEQDTFLHKEKLADKKHKNIELKRDTISHGYTHYHPDSIAKWNAQVIAAKEKYTLKPDKDTKFFTIDPNTGKVKGCPLIKFKGYLDDAYWEQRKRERKLFRKKFAELLPKIRKDIMQGHENELWYGDPDNVKITGEPEAIHSGRGPVGSLFTKNGKIIVVPVGYPHGGAMDEILFYDKNIKLISRYKLDKTLQMPNVSLNAEETFVIVSDGVSGDFYFFTIDGKLERKGNFNKLTGDKGTSYGKPNISKTGKYWSLSNNLTYIFDSNGDLVLKVPYLILKICDENKRIFFTETIDVLNRISLFHIFNFKTYKLEYISDSFKNKNYYYEYKCK